MEKPKVTVTSLTGNSPEERLARAESIDSLLNRQIDAFYQAGSLGVLISCAGLAMTVFTEALGSDLLINLAAGLYVLPCGFLVGAAFCLYARGRSAAELKACGIDRYGEPRPLIPPPAPYRKVVCTRALPIAAPAKAKPPALPTH